MVLCPICLAEGGHMLSCSCKRNYPWRVIARDGSGMTAVCMACAQDNQPNAQPRSQITKGIQLLQVTSQESGPDGIILDVHQCPRHMAYRVGLPRVSSRKCPQCGFVEETVARGTPSGNELTGYRKDDDQGSMVARSIRGY